MRKIFVSYTTRSSEINIKNLELIKEKLERFTNVYVYIELLDKNSSKKQENVINELSTSDYLLLLDTEYIDKSIWVQLELEYALIFNIPVTKLKPSFILEETQEYIHTMKKIK
ncbi:hypothetical protein SAMN05720606_112177 [Paenibacillus polysaccharolyticus]|uniref:TIR domain-containing protein n=1 Tax=Paenibacillus polysaccharolyticus TaxID=582692 RepID=A0A1G5JYL3_9BACL|nr:hypothetical protein [Paenibacillus polysaccharolyticus]SCY93512.1 hypothetical protein SAMN05720606_112177 [Paenibacillus polysaccharolyticus]